MDKDRLYHTLSDGQWHSGQALADQLGVSRTVVWKQVARLRGAGIQIEASKGKGYRLDEKSPKLFQRDRVISCLNAQAAEQLHELVIRDSTTSTNDECIKRLSARADAEVRGNILVLAERQTEGRGRRGKRWLSPFASNIYMSITARFEQGAASLSGLSLLVGITVAKVLNDLIHADAVQLKWPNDILIDGKKVGGILLEVSGDVAGPCQTIIGIGLNLDMGELAPGAIEQPYTDLSTEFPAMNWDKNRLAAQIVNELLQNVARFQQSGFAYFKSQWTASDAYLGRPVVIRQSEQQVETGTYKGVADDGSIILQTVSGEKRFGGGELSLRPAGV